MDSKNSNIKSAVLSLFDKGKSEIEAYDEISKTYDSHSVTLSVVSKWYEVFKSEECNLEKKKRGRKPKYTNEFLVNLVNDNLGLNMTELAKLANTSASAISYRLKQININGESLYNMVSNNKVARKLTDESLINLVVENPNLSFVEIGKITNTSSQNISSRIKRISEKSDKLQYTTKNKSKFTDEFLINLIDKNPELNMEELAQLAGSSISTISNRLKSINHDEKMVSYNKKGSQNGATKFTDEYLINLIKENPEFTMKELAALAGTSQPTISNRLKKINNNRPDGDKIIFTRHISKRSSNSTRITDEHLIQLVNDNPTLNLTELANIANIAFDTLSRRLNNINSNGEKVNYVKKKIKFTDEYLINLVKDNPELNMKELAKLAGTSPATILNRINQINSNGKIIDYQKKHSGSRRKILIPSS